MMRTENDFLLMLLGNQQTLKTFERLSFNEYPITVTRFQDLRNQATFHLTKFETNTNGTNALG